MRGTVKYADMDVFRSMPVRTRLWSCQPCGFQVARYLFRPQISVSEADELGRYRFGHGTADFLLCRRSGCLIAAVSRIDGRDCAVLNINTADGAERFGAPARTLDCDAEAPDERLERRRRNRIGQVRLDIS